jgi:hypothetical protein
MYKCFYTPTLDATIISPDAVGNQLGCRGYTTVSNFDGIGCEIRLRHCRQTSEDIVMKLTLCRSLLFTAPLIPASSAEHSGPIPCPLLHVRKIERDSDVSVSIADDASTASTIRADNRTCRDSRRSVPLVETGPETVAPVAPPLHDDAIDMFALHDDASAVSCGCAAPGASSCACFSANDTDSCKLLSTLEGPLEGTQEHCTLESEVGYSYRQVLGEIVYAYVVCCLDIGYAATFLSCFSQAPAREHYKALKDIVKYLRHAMDWGIIYWRQNPVDSLPRINLPDVPIDPSLLTFPTHDLLQLTGYVDAAHATDLKMRHLSLAMSLPWLVAPSHSNRNCKPPLLPVQLRQSSWLL